VIGVVIYAGAGAAAARSEVAAFFRVELLRRAVMELLLPWATAAAAAAAAKRRRQATAGSDNTASAATSPATDSSKKTHHDGQHEQQQKEITAVVGPAGLQAATGKDVATAERAAASAVTARAMATPTKHGVDNTIPSAAAAAAPAGLPDAEAVLSELARPRYDAFTDFWDMNRDMG
jgi:hypothetical protein